MNSFSLLVKNNFDCMVGALRGKKAKNKTLPALVVIALAGCGLVLLSFFQAYSLFLGMAPLNLNIVALFNGVLIAFVVVLLSAVMKITGNQAVNDAQFLLSLPIKKSTVVLAKTLTKYLFDLFLVFVFMMPYVVLFSVFEGFSISVILNGLIVVVLIPLFSVGFNYCLDFVVVHMFNKTKHAALLKSLISFVFFVITMGVFIMSMPSYGLLDPNDVGAFVQRFPPISWFLEFIANTNLLSLLWILLLTILPFALGSYLFSKNFGRQFIGYQSAKTQVVWKNKTSVLRSLIHKEIKRYFLTPIYVLNTIIGPFFMVALTVFIIINGKTVVADVLQSLSLSYNHGFAAIALMLCMFSALTLISSSSVSLEGKQFWILKSNPISTTNIFISKVMPNLLLTVPVILFCTVALSIALQFAILQSLLFILIPTFVAVSISFGGLFINLNYSKFDWVDETTVVKQGLSTLLAMLFGFIIAFLPAIVFMIFPTISIIWLTIATVIFQLLVCLGTIALVFTKGKTIFEKL